MKNLYKVTCYTPYCGTDMEYWVFADSEDDISKDDWEIKAYENGESYEYLATGWDEDFESDEARNDYYAECVYEITGPYTLEVAMEEEGFSGIADAEY